MTETCWTCLKPLPHDDTFGVVIIIHEAASETGEHIVRRCCTTTCARQAVTWTRPGNHERDIAHANQRDEAESLDDIAAGRTYRFTTAADAIEWLHAPSTPSATTHNTTDKAT